MSKFIKKQIKTVEKSVKHTVAASNEDVQFLKKFAQQYKLYVQGDLIQIGCPDTINSTTQEMINLTWLPGSGVAEDKIYRVKQTVKAAKTWESFVNNNMGDFANQYINLDVQGRVIVDYMHKYTNGFPNYGNQHSIHLEPAKNGIKYFEAVLPILHHNLNLNAKNNHSSMINEEMLNFYISPGKGTTAIKSYLKNSCLALNLPVSAIALENDQENKLAKEAEAKLKQESDAKALVEKQREAKQKDEQELAEVKILQQKTKLAIEKSAKEQAEEKLGSVINVGDASKIQNKAFLELDSIIIDILGIGGMADKNFYDQMVNITREHLPKILDALYNKYISEVQAEQEAAINKELALAMELSLKTSVEDKTKAEEKAATTNNNSVTNPYKLTEAELEFAEKAFNNGYGFSKGTAKAAVGLIITWNKSAADEVKKDVYANNPGINKLAQKIHEIIKTSSEEDATLFSIEKVSPASFKDLATMKLDKATPEILEQQPYKLTNKQVDFTNKMLDHVDGDQAAALRAILNDNKEGGNGGEHNTFNDKAYAALLKASSGENNPYNMDLDMNVEVAAAIYVSMFDHSC